MRELDTYSYLCGMMEGLCQVVHAGVKSLAFSRPLSDRTQWEELSPFAQEVAAHCGVHCYAETEPLITDLFPLSLFQGKLLYLFYGADHVLQEYLRLKERKAVLVETGAYFGVNRTLLAREYGRLLSYGADSIQTMLAKNREKELLRG